uniref:Uncharacterized protein n=1 Tax=mine drainage metagenome TaxID=410659 RepID=E6PYC7_9ZZZZ
MHAKQREVFFAEVVEYALSVVVTEGEGMDGACVVIAKLALWRLETVMRASAPSAPAPCPCPPMPHRTRSVRHGWETSILTKNVNTPTENALSVLFRFRFRLVRVHHVAKLLRRLEVGNPLGRNLHPRAGLRVAPYARIPLPNPKRAKPAYLDLVPGLQRAYHRIKDGLHNHLAIAPRQIADLGHLFH